MSDEPFHQLDPETERLIRENIPMVRRQAERAIPPHPYDHDDLYEIGLEELIRCARDFQPAFADSSFTAWAAQRVRWRIIDWIRTNNWGYQRHAHVRAKREAKPGERVAYQQEYPLSLDQPINGGSASVQDLRAVTAAPDDTTAEALSEVQAVEIADVVSALPSREAYVIRSYYWQGHTLRQIGASMGITESRVSQLHTKALSRLRPALRDAA